MKHKTTFEKLPQANTGRSKNWKTLRAICLLLFLSVSFTAYSQITVNVKDISLRASLKKIEQVSNYKFFYNESLPELNRKVSLNVKDATIEQTMQQLLGGMDLAYKKEQDNVIVLIRKAQDKSITKKITGTVVDEKGEPVIGASIVIKGESHGTITDFDGKFTLADVPEKGILTVSYIGYKTVDLSAAGQTFVKVVLQEDSKMIDEVVVVGYGVQSQKLVTTSISKVKMENIDQGNDYNPIKMLQGRVAGVNISSASGTPGEAPNVTVRGIGSVSGGSSPLYVVDGIPSEKYPNLNPNDIESMEVLKDASAAAIYGSRANAGVVLITTKSGQQGKTKIEVSGRYGFAYLASDIEMANSMEYMNTMQAAIDNYNVQMGANLQLYVPSQIQETNWVKEISRKNSKTGTGSISISGGNEKTTFFASLGANTQEGYLNKSSYDQYNMRAKFTHKINNLFKLNMNLAGSASRSDLLEETSTSLKVLRTAREEQPWYSPYKEDGTSYKVNGTDILRHNPVMLINEEDWVAKKYQLSGVFSIDVTPFKGFKYTPTVSVYGILDNTSKKLSDKHDARKNSSGWGALAEQKDQSFRYVIDNIFSYNNEWNKLIYSVMLGHSFEKYTYEQFGAKSDNYANGAFPSSNFDLINAGPNIYAGNISYTSYALESYFGRIALNWDNKYILNASLRSDGSSRFAKNKRYGYFPSASFAWRASNEEFFPKNKYVNDAKLRLSWGMTGSMAGVSNYAPLSLISAGGASYNGSAGFQISQDARENAGEVGKAAAATTTAANAANDETGALLAVTDEYGRVVYLTEDAARAMLGNVDAADSTATAAGNAADAMGQTAAAMNTATQTAAGNVDKLSAVATQVAAKEGDVADKTTETLENGLSAGEVTAEEAGGNIVQSLWDSICSKIDELFPNLGGKVQSAMSSALNGAKNALEQVTPTDPSTLVGNLLGGGSPVDALLSGSGLTTDDLIEAAQEDNNSGSTGGTGTTPKSTGSKTKKTLAQQISEKYKTRLEANKALREAMDSEYELWQIENQYSADADTLLAKKTENAAAEIANQTDRVAIAQAKYDELYSKWGADKTETRQAYADLLSEKTSLAKLKAEQ